ncbi:T3SS regulon translocated regulator ExsE family protein [Pseudomonas aeruginosa]|nr:T3SS regulon translocated regulator ExsE family protein [Pseudomonas aeruginosa]
MSRGLGDVYKRQEQALQRLADGDGTPLEARTVRRR